MEVVLWIFCAVSVLVIVTIVISVIHVSKQAQAIVLAVRMLTEQLKITDNGVKQQVKLLGSIDKHQEEIAMNTGDTFKAVTRNG